MPVGPDLLQVAVPSAVGVTEARYAFLLGPEGHRVEEPALGPEGEIDFTMDDWHAGMLGADEGVEYRKEPKYVSARGLDAHFPHQVIVQPVATTLSVTGGSAALAAPIKQIDFVPSGGTVGAYLIGEGRYVHRLTAATPTWTEVHDLGVGQTTRDIINVNDRLILAAGGGLVARDSADGSTWASLTIFADRWATLNDQLWRALQPNSLFSTLLSSSPYAWSSAYSLADTSFDVTSLTPVEQLLMIGKEDGVYSIASDGSTQQLVPELRPQANADFASLRATRTFNNDFFFRTLNGVLRIDAASGLKERVGLDQLALPSADIPTPVVRALTSDDRFLYILCDNSGGNGLMILRRTILGASHVFYWNSSLGRASHIAFSGVFGYPAIFFSYYDGANYITRFIRTSTFANPLDDTAYRFDTSSSLFIRFPRVGSASVQMLIDRLIVQSERLTAGRTIQFQVSIDGGAFQNFGSAVTTSPTANVVPAAAINGNFFDFRAVLVTDSATTTPILKGFSIKGVYRPARRRVHSFTIVLARGDETPRQGRLAKGVRAQTSDLNTLRGLNIYSTFTDKNGRTFEGVVLDVKRGSGRATLTDPMPHIATIVVAEKAA